MDRLVAFYSRALGCEPVGPRRDLCGAELERGMGLPGAHVRGVHLALPGAPATLEIFALDATVASEPAVNRQGLMHLCFRVEDVAVAAAAVQSAGGTLQGAPATVEVAGVGSARFVYARDPEGNLVELQQWLTRHPSG